MNNDHETSEGCLRLAIRYETDARHCMPGDPYRGHALSESQHWLSEALRHEREGR